MANNVVSFVPSVMPKSAAVPFVSTLGARDDTVAKTSLTYDEGALRRELPRTLMGGTVAMRAAGEKYLPKHPVESSDAYESRLQNAFLYNAFEMTITAQAAKFFGEPVELKEDVPPELQKLCENIDGEGRALTPFCIDMVKEAFVDGISFVLVDFPNAAAEGAATMADQKRIGARPYWVLVLAENVIGWRDSNVGGQQIPTLVRIKENVAVPEGEYGEKISERIRELRPGSWRVWEKQKDAANPITGVKWVVIEEGSTSLSYIPLVPFYACRKAFFDGSPPLRALAEMNQEHWISLSEQKRALSFARFDMLVISGVEDSGTGVEIGPNKVLVLPTGGTASTVTQGGQGLESGRKDLGDIEQRMQTAGLELRVENAGQTTATAAAIDSSETNAGLRAVAKGLEDAIEICLQISADFLSIKAGGGTVEIADAFGGNEIEGTALDITTLNTAGIISKPTAWSELKRRQILGEDFDPEKEQLLLQDEQAQQLDNAMRQQEMFAQFAQPPASGNQPPPGEGQ